MTLWYNIHTDAYEEYEAMIQKRGPRKSKLRIELEQAQARLAVVTKVAQHWFSPAKDLVAPCRVCGMRMIDKMHKDRELPNGMNANTGMPSVY